MNPNTEFDLEQLMFWLDQDGRTLWSDAVRDLKTELEQAEKKRDEWMTPFDGSGTEWHESLPSPYTYQASDFSKLVAAVHEYEAALRERSNWYLVDHDRDDKIVRGPYDSASVAGAVRRELERDGYYAEEGNLWIVSDAYDDLREAKQ
jgi:hypothetical protein